VANRVPSFAQPLREQDIAADPVATFLAWFAAAGDAGIRSPEAAAVATATSDGRPSVRMVLVKEFGADGFVFFTNYESRKGRELAQNPYAALLFHWDALGRQVRIEGDVSRLDPAESESYIRSRPLGSQISALASPQSQVVVSREALEERVADLGSRYADGELPIPEAWGGFRVRPESIEFWQHREDRLHDRLLYVRGSDGGWRIERLAP
jgi:pyridoxamine 5'-phosphate oxidase